MNEPSIPPATPDQREVGKALFAFAQNFGFDWHPTFIRWLTDELLAEFTVLQLAGAVRAVMLREERPWSPFGSIRSEAVLIARGATEEETARERKRREAERLERDGPILPPAESARRLRETMAKLGKTLGAP